MNCTILPSLLAADPGYLADGAKQAAAAGADALHLDIMDGHFVPNISMGPNVVAMAKRHVSIPLNVHLMLSRPDQYIEAFAKAGAETLYIHVEAACPVAETLENIRDLGLKPGITLNPQTAPEACFAFLPLVSDVLVMTVHPGYGGQSFMPEVLPSIRSIRQHCQDNGLHSMQLMVDGGINLETAQRCAEAGANAFVAGTYLYAAEDMRQTIADMRSKTHTAYAACWPT